MFWLEGENIFPKSWKHFTSSRNIEPSRIGTTKIKSQLELLKIHSEYIESFRFYEAALVNDVHHGFIARSEVKVEVSDHSFALGSFVNVQPSSNFDLPSGIQPKRWRWNFHSGILDPTVYLISRSWRVSEKEIVRFMFLVSISALSSSNFLTCSSLAWGEGSIPVKRWISAKDLQDFTKSSHSRRKFIT